MADRGLNGIHRDTDRGLNGIHRDTWYIPMKASRVTRAAKAKVKFHKSRVAYWTKEREKAHKAVRAKGLKLAENPQFPTTDSVAAYASNKVRTAEVDYKLIEQWQQCNQKVEQHKAKVREYEKWVAFLTHPDDESKKADNLLNLTFADAEFFGMVAAPVGNE